MTAVSTLPRAAHAGRVGEVPDPEVPERARRRTFTAQYKLDILAEYDAADAGGKGAVLRREGLYSSHIVEWRRLREAGALAGLGRPRGRRPADPGEAELARLRREKERLERELAKAQFVIDVQGKLSALLEKLSESADTDDVTPPSSPGSTP
jgi:transposase